MRFRGGFAALALSLCLCASARAEGPATSADGPLLSGTSATRDAAAAAHQLLVFKGTLLLNEFIYRAVMGLPQDATASPETSKLVAATLANFLREAGYELAKVRAQVKGDQIEVEIDEGALDKIIVFGTGWLTALRFRSALAMPMDVFNRRLFELQMPKLARQFGLSNYRYELWPVHLLDTDNAAPLEGIEELRAMPMLRAARGYELRVLTHGDPWGAGFSPEIILNGSIGFGVGGRYRLKDVIQDGDRWQAHFRLGGTMRSSLDPNGGTHPVNTLDYVTTRWLSPPLGGKPAGLRITVAPRFELWTLQRSDLNLDSYRIQTLELGAGAGSQLSSGFALFFTTGVQRRWIFNVEATKGTALSLDVTQVPNVSNRGFLRANSTYTFNPDELRQDMRDSVALELNAVAPMSAHGGGFFRFDLQGRKLFALGWHELRTGLHLGGALGDIWYPDDIPLDDFLRIGFGLAKHTHRAGTLSLEFRYSLLRDKVKLAVFNDVGLWRHLPRDDVQQGAELAGSAGGGIGLFLLDQLQLDVLYGVGWSADGYMRNGLALSIKEAF
jgi:hypothetical protein